MSKETENWPQQFIYTERAFSADLHPHLIGHFLLADAPEEEREVNGVHAGVKIEKLKPPHPLAGELGLFASEEIAAKVSLGEYAGELRFCDASWPIDPKECDYAWTLKLGSFSFMIDAKKWANELAFVNDYRGIREKPNATARWATREGLVFLTFETLEEIPAGHEILIDYGTDYWRAPHRRAHFNFS